MTVRLDGGVVSEAVLAQLKGEIDSFNRDLHRVPGLAVILVGYDPASTVYVASKKKACEAIGIQSFEYRLEDTVTESDIESLILDLNSREDVNGILLQLPLPKGLNSDRLLNLISPDKDVDGFHPINVGKLLLGLDTFRSCTPYGVLEILRFYKIPTSGRHVVILGRSNIVGKPQAAMLIQHGWDATVTICHSKTTDLPSITRQADILIAAIGRPHFVTADMVKPGAVVIDVGINRIEDMTAPKGYRIVGDVAYDEVAPLSSAITPVPGGVGRMTIAMLMKNTVNAFKNTL